MPISEKTQIIESVHYLIEEQDSEDPSSFQTKHYRHGPAGSGKGQSASPCNQPAPIRCFRGSAKKLPQRFLRVLHRLPIRPVKPVFEAQFQKQGVLGLVWLSEPLTKPGRFDFNLVVELEDYDPNRPSKGNHKIIIWPMMVVDDDPPD